MPTDLEKVPLWGKTGSHRHTFRTTRMTHFGYRQQFSEPCDLTAWGKHQSERFTAAISPKSKKWRMNRSRLLVVSYRVIWSKKGATSGAFFGRL